MYIDAQDLLDPQNCDKQIGGIMEPGGPILNPTNIYRCARFVRPSKL